MKIVYLAAGAAGMYCGSCLHDNTLAAALLKSENNRRKGLGTASAHFSFAEVQCRCRGKYSTCQRIWMKRKTFVMMEQYRTKSKKPFTVVSGCDF